MLVLRLVIAPMEYSHGGDCRLMPWAARVLFDEASAQSQAQRGLARGAVFSRVPTLLQDGFQLAGGQKTCREQGLISR